MTSPDITNEQVGVTIDLLGDASSLTLEKESLGTVRKKWTALRISETKASPRPLLIITTKERLKTTPPPMTQARFGQVLLALRPNFRQVFAHGQQVLALDADSGRHILASGHIADANLTHNGYCLAIQPRKAEVATLRSHEFQLLYASYFYRHKKRERTALVKEWISAHHKVFKSADIVRNLSLIFEVTPRTIYNDLKHLTENAK